MKWEYLSPRFQGSICCKFMQTRSCGNCQEKTPLILGSLPRSSQGHSTDKANTKALPWIISGRCSIVYQSSAAWDEYHAVNKTNALGFSILWSWMSTLRYMVIKQLMSLPYTSLPQSYLKLWFGATRGVVSRPAWGGERLDRRCRVTGSTGRLAAADNGI